MTSATNLAALELPEPPVRPHLTLLDGRVKESVLIGRALAGGARGRAAEEELYRRYRPAVSRLAASFSELEPGAQLPDLPDDAHQGSRGGHPRGPAPRGPRARGVACIGKGSGAAGGARGDRRVAGGAGEGDRSPLLPGRHAFGARDRPADGRGQERRHHAARAVPGEDQGTAVRAARGVGRSSLRLPADRPGSTSASCPSP